MAWSDSDISMVRNVFTIMSRWFDFTASWSGGNDGEPMAIYEKTAGYTLKVDLILPRFIRFSSWAKMACMKLFIRKNWQV